MTPDTTLTLGSFQFAGLEIPSQISGLGAAQALAVHKLVGGSRVIDAMGQDFHPIEWSGLFFGSNAMARMNQLKALAVSGAPQKLAWHTFNYLVIIRDFTPDERRQFEIPYHISCEVVSDNSYPVASSDNPTIDSVIADGMSAAQIQYDLINDQALTAQMGLLATAIDAIDTFSEIESSLLESVLQPLTAAQNIVSALIGTNESTISAQAGFAGVVVGSDALTMALALDATEAAVFEETELWNLAGILGVMAANLNAVNGSPNTLATAGGNLFAIAALEYGDPMDWTAIATANNLVDPFIDGAVTLTIPLSPVDNGGILNS